MSKHIVLKIESGSFATGFQVVLSYFDKGKISRREQDGKLPAAPGLLKAYTDFRQAFFCHENTREFIPVDLFRIVVPLNQVTNPKGIRECALDLNNQFQSWLNKLTPEIKLELIYSLRQPELVQFILKISNSEDSEILEKLPWHTWEFFKTYNISVEITLDRILESPNRNKLGKTVRILAVLGNDIGINVQEDLHILKKIWGAWVTELNKPSREELTTALRQQPWDILFFAGHSGSDKKSGRLYLNNKKDLKENSLKLDEIPRALDKAVESGLKMAIFNSCDGLGLVSPLVNAGIPWVVVMREPVSDAVAHDFLRYFLEAFSQGTPFVQAIREARDQIGEKHGHLPWEWLPVVCQSQSAVPLVWPQWSILLNRHMPWISNHFDRLKTQVNQRAQFMKGVAITHHKFLFLVSIMILSGVVSIIITPQAQQELQLDVACDKKIILASKLTSCGGESDFISLSDEEAELPEKKRGTIAFANENFEEAVDYLSKAWEQKKDPSTLIALNNAYVMRDLQNGTLQKEDVFAIAIASGFKKTPKEIGGSILAGVAWRQKEVNNKGKFKLLVIMADDQNDPEIALKIAKELINNKQILGVIGPYSSRATYYVLDTYKDNKMVLVSSTSTATLEAYKNEDKKICQDFSWFFRPIPTTRTGSKALLKYLEKKGYKYIKIFYQDQDLFGKSFYMDFKSNLKDSKLTAISPDVQYIKKTEAQIAEEIIVLKKTHDRNKTALVVLADAYTNAKSRPKKIRIVSENKGTFFIAGSNTLFENDFLNLFPKISKESLEKSIISIPWYPSSQSLEKLNSFFKVENSDNNLRFWSIDRPQLTWHMAMSYDATQMFVEAISQQVLRGKKPTREGMRDALANPKFKTEGLTGTITLNGSDRADQFASLIRPNCSTTSCAWQQVERYLGQ